MDKLCNLAELFEWIEMIKLSFDWKNEQTSRISLTCQNDPVSYNG